LTSLIIIISLFFCVGCNCISNTKHYVNSKYFLNRHTINKNIYAWNKLINIASNKYQVDNKLIKSIIYVESSGNPYATSRSNAIGLMQIKPSSAGIEVYRLYKKQGQPSIKELYNPKTNIDMGTAYLSLLQKKNFLESAIKI
jgi:membrane-bound lytic murein transglycosylase E